MDQVLFGVSEFASAYLDDIVVYSVTWKDNLEHLRRVFQCLKKAGLTINLSKCAFARVETEYLGYTIGNGII